MTPPALTLPDDDCKPSLLLSSLGTGETDEIRSSFQDFGALGARALAWSIAGTAPAQANLVLNGDFTGTTLSSPGGYLYQLGATCVSNLTDWGSVCSSLGICGAGGTPGSLLFRGTNGVAWNNYIGLAGAIADPPTGNCVGIDGDPVFQAPIFQTINGLVLPGGRAAKWRRRGDHGPMASLPGRRYQNSSRMSIPAGGFWSESERGAELHGPWNRRPARCFARRCVVERRSRAGNLGDGAGRLRRPRPYRLSPRAQDPQCRTAAPKILALL